MKSAHQSTTLMSPLNEKFTYLGAAGYSKPALVDNNRFCISPELTKEEFYRMEQTVSLSQQGGSEYQASKYFTYPNNGHTVRDGGNNFRFPDIALYTGRFRLILIHISSAISFRVDIRQLSLSLFCRLMLYWRHVILICQIVLGYYSD